ncbi:hypothetical protein FB451DRAFT_1477946 [Mycena latifolia]|nr:hypothetical protein FB451DRAFT_1477946 [Mycena latifolia]
MSVILAADNKVEWQDVDQHQSLWSYFRKLSSPARVRMETWEHTRLHVRQALDVITASKDETLDYIATILQDISTWNSTVTTKVNELSLNLIELYVTLLISMTPEVGNLPPEVFEQLADNLREVRDLVEHRARLSLTQRYIRRKQFQTEITIRRNALIEVLTPYSLHRILPEFHIGVAEITQHVNHLDSALNIAVERRLELEDSEFFFVLLGQDEIVNPSPQPVSPVLHHHGLSKMCSPSPTVTLISTSPDDETTSTPEVGTGRRLSADSHPELPSQDSTTPKAEVPSAPPRDVGTNVTPSEEAPSPGAQNTSRSHFPFIYLPEKASPLLTAPALRCEDVMTLEKEFSEGGVAVSVYSPDDAVSWLESHYDDPLLESLRARNFQGPIAMQLGPAESALLIFGSIADAMIPQLAKALAQASKFAVIIRSSVENPLLSFDLATPKVASTASNEKPAVESMEQPTAGPAEQPLTVSAEQPAARLRGGAADPDGDDASANHPQPMPKCKVQYDVGKAWESEDAEKLGKDFGSYDVQWRPEPDRDNVAHEMQVEFGLGLHLRHDKRLYNDGIPLISFVLRNQILVWVTDPVLRTRSRGILLLTSTYIPNALTDKHFTIYKTSTVNLSQDPPVDVRASATPSPVTAGGAATKHPAMSVSVAPLKKRRPPSVFGKFLDKLSFKPSPPELPMYETVSHGWDVSNMRWKSVVWPTLDHQFHSVPDNSVKAAWKLRWATEPAHGAAASPARSKVSTLPAIIRARITPKWKAEIEPSISSTESTGMPEANALSEVGTARRMSGVPEVPSQDFLTPKGEVPPAPPGASGTDIASEEVSSPEGPSTRTPSHFPIIYPPGEASALPSPPAFHCEDATTLESEFAAGGVTVSVYSPDDAVSWLELHYEDPLLESLRARNFQGPIAMQLGPGEAALALFGSIADAMIPQLAKALAEASGFAVVVRSSVDNPLFDFAQATVATQLRVLTSEQPTTVSTEQPVVRLRGGATDSDDDDEESYYECSTDSQIMLPVREGQPHTAKINLTLKLGNAKYNVEVSSDMKFKTQPLSQSNPDVLYLPEVLASVSLKVKLCRGETSLDRSFSNLGFLVHRSRSILLCDFLDLGYAPPDIKLKRTAQKSNALTAGAGISVKAGVPTVSANAAYTRNWGDGLEAADEKPMPKCKVQSNQGRAWEREEANKLNKDFRSYDVQWRPEPDRDNVENEMQVEFGLGIRLVHDKRLSTEGIPTISSVLRNQILVWVSDPGLQSKGRGILLLTSTYIPNARTDKCSTLIKSTTVNLNQDPPVAVRRAANPVVAADDEGTERAEMSVSVAPLDTLSLKPDIAPELPVYETVARGWDAKNMRWKNDIWPTLDDTFHGVPDNSKKATWKLQWPPDPANIPSTSATGSAPASSVDPIPAVVVSQPIAISNSSAPIGLSTTSSNTTEVSDTAPSTLFDPDGGQDATTISTSIHSSSIGEPKKS